MITETILLNEIKQKNREFFRFNTLNQQPNTPLVKMCMQIVTDIIRQERYLDYGVIDNLKSNLSLKRLRNPSNEDYRQCLIENIVFELYKYSDVIHLFECIKKYNNQITQIDYGRFITLVQENCKKDMSNFSINKKYNSELDDIISGYKYSDIQRAEIDYMCSCCMTNILFSTMNGIIFGQMEMDNRRIPVYSLYAKFSSFENMKTLDAVIVEEVSRRFYNYHF